MAPGSLWNRGLLGPPILRPLLQPNFVSQLVDENNGQMSPRTYFDAIVTVVFWLSASPVFPFPLADSFNAPVLTDTLFFPLDL
jgi:hypothetical protein